MEEVPDSVALEYVAELGRLINKEPTDVYAELASKEDKYYHAIEKVLAKKQQEKPRTVKDLPVPELLNQVIKEIKRTSEELRTKTFSPYSLSGERTLLLGIACALFGFALLVILA